MSTYLSRDGGLNWAEIRKGPFIYEIGDHGALIVMAKHGVPTNEVLYSYNEGKTWQELRISDENILVSNIIIEPLSISQQFVVYGTETDSGDWGESDGKNLKGVIVTIDFASLHSPKCKGVHLPGSPDSDYEFWTPHDGRHGEN